MCVNEILRTMLQPRVVKMKAKNVDVSVNDNFVVGNTARRRMSAGISNSVGLCAIISLVFLSGFTLCHANPNDDQIAADRVHLSGDSDVTTVLLVDNRKLTKDINARNGRYLNVKPVIGLLTSTARTFIQDGVTTEYATEILGTTLDNGKVYAQLLTKSSLVLYDKPVNAEDRKTRLPFEMDDRNRWNLEESLSELDRGQYVIKNTDYVSPKDGLDLFTVYPSKPIQSSYSTVWNARPVEDVTTETNPEILTENIRIQEVKEIPKYNEFEAFNFLDPIPFPRERKISAYNNINIEIKDDERTNKAIDLDSEPKDNSVTQTKKSQSKGIDPVKVNPNVKLPTYTVKNEFSPIFYYIDNVESKTEKSSSKPNYLKNAKKLFGHKDEQKPLKTYTYYGFSNFTTMVGDTVIVFSPSTATEAVKQQEITPSVKPEVLPNVATRVKTFLSSDLNMVTKTMFGHQLNMETALPTYVMNPQESVRTSKAYVNDEENLKNVLYEQPIKDEEQVLSQEDKRSRVIASLKEGLFNRQKTQFVINKDVIQSSETTYSTILRTHSTDKLQVNEETIKDDKVFSIKPTEPLTFFSPSSVLKASEGDDESSAEVTTSSSDENVTENETGPTTETDSETSPYTEDTLSTPPEEEENEKEEEIESNSEDATCTGGIVPVSTMTTAYKTLTYLTTYFIPLEGTETTTSIKSSLQVTSETGYLTNLACKTEEPIEITPTSRSVDQPEATKIQTTTEKSEEVDEVTEAILPVLTTTPDEPDEISVTTEKVKETTEKVETTTQSEKQVEDITDNKVDDKTTSMEYTTTEHAVTTSESHMEVSVTTEENKPGVDVRVETPETTTESEDEIDLIFKTLYTTYTYFTTYFQGSTSTVSSKKSVVTNVITSTLDLSEIDPSIFNAIESSDYLFKATQMEELGEIQPTSVGIGRPTQSLSLNSIIDLVQHRQVIDSVQSDAILTSKIPTPELEDEKLFDDVKADVVKTFYTTYTFFTTLYVEQDANICSRTEVYTNYVGPSSLLPTKTSQMSSLNTRSNEIDFKNCKKVPADQINRPALEKEIEKEIEKETLDIEATKPKQHTYSSINRSNKKTAETSTETSGSDKEDDINEVILNNGDSMLVTDIKSSYSKGDRQIIDNSVLDDQVSSESNIDEIMPSPTLLLQTSFTTFTYFTTMYIGKDSTKVKSRLETVTNVVTETLNPKSAEIEETNLPITYYTTFTYWTTLYKDKTTTITSREDIVSNVVTPTLQAATANPIDTSPIEVNTVKIEASSKIKDGDEEVKIEKTSVVDDMAVDDGKATFFTTYTYFTTYYVGNTSELRSSLETITNVVDNTKDLVNENQLGRAVGKQSPAGNLLDGNNEKPVIVPTVLPDVIIPTKVVGDNAIVSTHIAGTLNDGDGEKKIISSQVAIISGDSTIISGGQVKVESESSTLKDGLIDESMITTPGITTIEGSVTDPTTPQDGEESDDEDDDDEDNGSKKKSRLTFSSRKRTFTPVIRPFSSRGSRPTFIPNRNSLASGATTITRSDFTQTITATPAFKSTKSGGFGSNRKQSTSAYPGGGAGGSRRFSRVSSSVAPSASTRTSGFGRGRVSDIQPTNARRGGFRTSSARPNIEFSTRGVGSRIRPTLSSRYRGSKQTTTPSLNNDDSTAVTENPSTSEDGDSTPSTDDSGSRRTTNSLLRFRRPPFTRAPSVTTSRTPTQGTTRRGSFNRGRNGATSTTSRPAQRSTQNPLFALRNRQRPNALFPPRGLINKQPEPQPDEETNADQDPENEENQDDLEEEGDEDSDYESSDRQESQVATTTTTSAPKRISNSPVIKPFGFRRRSKRQTDYGTRRSYANFRRPTARTPKKEVTAEPEPEVITAAPKRTQGRFSSRNSAQHSTSRPATRAPPTSRPQVSSRQSFALRSDSKTSSATTSRPTFRSRTSGRSTTAKSSSNINLRPKAPRLKTYATAQTEAPRSTSRSASRRPTSRSRTTTRYRPTSNDIVDSNYANFQIPNDGKLTITHKIPIEVTIPVVNGKLTEYKNVLTAKPSIEVLQPNQYSTTKNAFGSQYIVLVSESSEPAENGATKVIQFILHETPTTSVIFTPTTIRGRRTSFSHIIPSTVYDVERVTSTVQPQINANVPLANILLSQLLLGNLGMPQPINPLLALQGQPGIPQTPTTEFKIKTTTYVTTVTDAKSTVLPITFRGKEILTTIIDSKVDVITATEFITETVVVTPTVAYPGFQQQQNPNQLNSILLLLQQQQQVQQQQQQQQQTVNPLLGLQPDLNLLQNNQQLFGNDLLNSPKPEVLDIKDPEDYLGLVEEEVTRPPKRKIFKARKPAPARETSVITLYVSGRTPGEFSTVLSTIVVDETQSIQKREAMYYEYDVNPSDLPGLNEIITSSQSDLMLDSFLMPAMEEMSHNTITQSETQSLESIIGEVSKYMTLDNPSSIMETASSDPTTVVYVVKQSEKLTGR